LSRAATTCRRFDFNAATAVPAVTALIQVCGSDH
jgi:hypothetical protein